MLGIFFGARFFAQLGRKMEQEDDEERGSTAEEEGTREEGERPFGRRGNGWRRFHWGRGGFGEDANRLGSLCDEVFAESLCRFFFAGEIDEELS